ncbi:ATP-binding protein [Streptomyces sp. NBC_00829]|uniref:ATP-binding protein n=1 Tax=Streptomyces sp. NBC_00829 TaxID=2903679 RepID=UPI002F90DB90|nr:ATP-binding protein [Streptomyces sp. NBC_00829]
MAHHENQRRANEGLLTRVARALGVLAVLVALLPAGLAYADGGDDDCSDVDVCVGAGTDGKPGGGGGSGGGSGGGGGGGQGDGKCKLVDDTEIDCLPGYNPADRCFYELMAPQPPSGPGHPDMNGADTSGPGAFYLRDCIVNDVGGIVWLTQPPATVLPDPEVLARQARDKMTLLGAAIGSAPGPDQPGLVGMPVWLWNHKSDTTWGPNSATAAVPGLSVTATARVTKITYSMGDGGSVTCTTAGTPYKQSYGNKSSPDCGHRYTKVSAGQPGGKFTITATSSWEVTWQASNGASGTLPDEIRTSTTTARVGELQVVN